MSVRARAGISVGFLILLVGICGLYSAMKRRKFTTLREKFFNENGGLLLRNVGRSLAIFTSEELEKATNDFNESQQISEGVYRGILSDRTVVAINTLNEAKNPAKFVDEMIDLSQNNHRNVVKLLGCCLETYTPLLVYEFISNDTLYEHIHKIRMRGSSPFSLYWRIKAAAETAAALAYLHSSISNKPVIIPQIVDTRNILFYDNYMVKLLLGREYLLDDEDGRSTLVQKTIGYLDPEYIQSSTLTEKSNVYSLGVVLAELLTSQKAVNYERPEGERLLAPVFARAVEGGTLHRILDDEILKEGNIEMVEKVADLAIRCLRDRGTDRPSMKEVAMELEGLRIMANHPGGILNFSESPQNMTDPLVTPSDAYVVDHVGDEGFDGGSSSVLTNAEAMSCRRLQEVDYYLT